MPIFDEEDKVATKTLVIGDLEPTLIARVTIDLFPGRKPDTEKEVSRVMEQATVMAKDFIDDMLPNLILQKAPKLK